MRKYFIKNNSGFTRIVDFGDAISSRTISASPKLTTGFTIIETMVAISVFLVVIIAGMGALLNANLLHNKSGNIRQIMDNLSFAMEDMSRSLRTGYNYDCLSGQGDRTLNASTSTSCQVGWGVTFEQQNGDPNNGNDQWSYYISNDSVDTTTGKTYGAIKKSTDGGQTQVQLTSPEVHIDPNASQIDILGAEAPNPSAPSGGNRQQPLVNIRLVGTITTKDGVTPFSLQTSVSQRALDI